MASGKSLELAEIKRKPGSPKCICGGLWASHLRKDGEVLARYSDTAKHQPKSAGGFNRQMRRKMGLF